MKYLKILFWPLLYLVRLVVVARRVNLHNRRQKQIIKDKEETWPWFYSKNKKWIDSWYKIHGLKSSPPIMFDEKTKKWSKLNRQQRRHPDLHGITRK